MPNCRLGAHTFIFQQYGFDHVKQIDKIAETVAEAGFPAIELHHMALEGDDFRPRITSALRPGGLELIGASHGQPLWNIAEYERALEVLDVHSDKLSEMGEGLKCGLSCSGKHLAQRSDRENKHLVEAWTETAEIFNSKDLILAYHTHGEPLEDILHLVENVPDLMFLGPDLDWLRVGGVEPEAFLREHADQLTMIHIRDYHLGDERTAALGEGDVDYAELGGILDEIGFQGDLIVELALPSGTRPEKPVLDLLRDSREHLRETMGI